MDDHSSRMPVASASQATNPNLLTRDDERGFLLQESGGSYAVLLPMGFAMPSLLPATRCALTTPFHPYRYPLRGRRFALCGTVPEVALAGRYPASYRLEPGLSSPCLAAAAAIRLSGPTMIARQTQNHKVLFKSWLIWCVFRPQFAHRFGFFEKKS